MASVNNTINVTLDKCIVSGCPSTARGRVKHGDLGFEFQVCGLHRAPISKMLNEAAEPIHVARGLATVAVIDGLNALGDHDAELALAG